MACGITAGTGDTSWPHLRNQANPWQAQVLSAADNETVNGAATSVVAYVHCPCRRGPGLPSGHCTPCGSLCLQLAYTSQLHLAARSYYSRRVSAPGGAPWECARAHRGAACTSIAVLRG